MSIRSERIKSLIEQSQKSYLELEKATGIKKSSLQRYASGATTKIPLDVIEKLSKAFNVSQEYLMGWSEEQKNLSPDKLELTEGEKVWLELYHQLSSETKAVLVNMAEEFENLSADRQKFLLDAVRVVFDNQK